MSKPIVRSLIVSLLLLLAAGSAGAQACQFAFGPAAPVEFAPNPQTGFIEFSVPMSIGGVGYQVDLQVAILGFLEVAADGSPRRALVTHTWNLRANGVRIEWVGEAEAVATDAPNQVYYRLRLDLVTANRRYDAGTVFIEGIFNLDGTGDARNVFGKLCQGGDDD